MMWLTRVACLPRTVVFVFDAADRSLFFSKDVCVHIIAVLYDMI
jgi:hypothetical protein